MFILLQEKNFLLAFSQNNPVTEKMILGPSEWHEQVFLIY